MTSPLEEDPLIAFIIRRLLTLIPVLWMVVTIVWVVMFYLPGDPARLMAGGQSANPDVIRQVRADWGLDKPAPVQYWHYLSRVSRGNLGESYLQRRPVTRILAEALPATFILALSAILIASLGGVALGTLSAVYARRWLDDLLSFLSLVWVSTPVFWLGLMLILLFASTLGWLPVLGYGMNGWTLPGTTLRLPEFRHLILPALTLAMISLGTIARYTRASLLEVLGQDYIRTAAAQGMAPWLLYFRQALRNALIPILTVIGIDFAALLGGAVATEFVFAWPGLGKTIVRGIAQRDLPLVEGGVICLSVAFVMVNLLVDICYAWADPRIKLTRVS